MIEILLGVAAWLGIAVAVALPIGRMIRQRDRPFYSPVAEAEAILSMHPPAYPGGEDDPVHRGAQLPQEPA